MTIRIERAPKSCIATIARIARENEVEVVTAQHGKVFFVEAPAYYQPEALKACERRAIEALRTAKQIV